MTTICSVDSCARDDINSRDLCNMHYARYRRHGDPLGGRQRATEGPAQALTIRSRDEGSCRIWTGSGTDNGYGVVNVGAKSQLAHRVAFELANGPIPPGMVIDHTCHTRACIKPEHLRAVTQKQNLENNAVHNRRNKSGVRGVHWSESSGKWIAQVCHNYKRRYVGSFAVLADAEAAVIKLRNELFTHNDLDRMA